MRIPRVFIDSELQLNSSIRLPADQSHYLIRVLRKPLDSPVMLFNGLGGEFQGIIRSYDRHSVTVELQQYSAELRESPLQVSLGIGLSKGDRVDWVIKKTTELGVQRITPLFTEYCDVKLYGKSLHSRMQHWHGIATSACEQSGRTKRPIIEQPIPIRDWLRIAQSDVRLILHPGSGNTDLLALKKPSSLSLLVGSEGGFSKQEVQEANAHNFLALKLGPRILRTETAPVAILSVVGYLWGDLSTS